MDVRGKVGGAKDSIEGLRGLRGSKMRIKSNIA